MIRAIRRVCGLGLFVCGSVISLQSAYAVGFNCHPTHDVEECVASPQSAHIASADCQRAGDVVEKTICADPRLSALSAQLSAVYANLQARDPVQTAALQSDQRNWLSERDVQVWRVLSDPDRSSADAWETLAGLYKLRIAFLRRVDVARLDQGSPALLALLAAIPSLPKNTIDVLAALQSSGLVVLAQAKHVTGIRKLTATLPAPPSAALSAALTNEPNQWRYGGDAHFTYSYLPSGRIGGVYTDTVSGSAARKNWQLFAARRGTLQPINAPPVLGYLAMLDGYPATISQTIGTVTQTVDLRWQRGMDGRWGVPVRVRVRFDHVLKVAGASCATTLDCAVVRDVALNYARRYDKRPLPSTLADTDGLSPKQRARFLRMQSLAKKLQQQAAASPGTVNDDRRTDNVSKLPQFGGEREYYMDAFGKDATTFPVRVDGHLLLGRIGHGYLGWRQSGYWMVGFWQWQDGKLQSLAGVVIDRDNAGVLLAARMPPKLAFICCR